MLERTFLHLPGIDHHVERSLWEQGCCTWSDLQREPCRFDCGDADREKVRRALKRTQTAFDRGEHQFFRSKLGKLNAWRAFAAFRHATVYLDIETDGGVGGKSITTIGLFDGKEFRCLVRGEDLENFRDLISHYSMIVTFFGTGFDLPMLQKRFPDIKFDQIHLDLHPALGRLGFRGGLKKIEKQVGIERPSECEGLNGRDAIRLWRKYERFHDDQALETLIAYNREDVVNMEKLAEIAYAGLYRSCIGQEPDGSGRRANLTNELDFGSTGDLAVG